jgi:thiamine biosynthesis protein ThiS
MDAINNDARNREREMLDEQQNHIEIIVNGQPQRVAQDATVSQLLQVLSIESRYVVVQIDRQIVPRDQFTRRVLQAGNKLEIITLAGGG